MLLLLLLLPFTSEKVFRSLNSIFIDLITDILPSTVHSKAFAVRVRPETPALQLMDAHVVVYRPFWVDQSPRLTIPRFSTRIEVRTNILRLDSINR